MGGSVRGGRYASVIANSSHFCRQGGDETDGGRRELRGKGERSYVSGSGSGEWIFPYPWGPCMDMYGMFTYIYHSFKPNVGEYTSPIDPMGKFQIYNAQVTWLILA